MPIADDGIPTQQEALALRSLLTHPGWDLIRGEIQQRMTREHRVALGGGVDAAARGEAAAAYRALDGVLQWPTSLLNAELEAEDD